MYEGVITLSFLSINGRVIRHFTHFKGPGFQICLFKIGANFKIEAKK